MTREELSAIPRKTAREILASIPGGRGYDDRVMVAIECAMNTEWWRGFHAGTKDEHGRPPEVRMVLCEACGGEGRIYSGHPNNPHPREIGPCPTCEGTGLQIVEVFPISLPSTHQQS